MPRAAGAAIQMSQQMFATAQAMEAAAAQAGEGEGSTEHGGKTAPMESLDKHQAERTGAMQGIGGNPTPFGAGGMVQ